MRSTFLNARRAVTAAMACMMIIASLPAPGADLDLALKARIFENDMAERFVHEGQLSPKLRLPSGDRTFNTYNMPDNAYMTGLYCAAETWRHEADPSSEGKTRAREAVQALNHLLTVSGKPGLLARASWPLGKPWQDDGIWRETTDGKYRWRGDVSSDQVDGVIFGYYVYWASLADDEEKLEIARHVDAMVSSIVDNDLTIRGFDGEITLWGHYEPDYVREKEPMNALLMLQMLKVAGAITGEEKFDREYRRLISDYDYAKIAERSRSAARPERVNHSDDVLIAIGLYPLLELESDPEIRGSYLKAASRWFLGAGEHPGLAVESNPFFTFLHHHWTGDGKYDVAAIKTLDLMPLDMKFNRATIAAFEEQYDFEFDPAPRSAPAEPGEPTPIDRRLKSWSFIVHNPYRETGERAGDSGMEFQGLDYTLSYWFGRARGFVPRDI